MYGIRLEGFSGLAKLILLATVLLCTRALSAQEEEFAFGEIDMADMEMVSYDLDTSAAAVMLKDNGLLGYDRISNRYYFIYHAQIKVLRREGFNWADLTLPYEGKRGLEEFEGATYNLVNGKIQTTEVSKEQMQEESVLDNLKTSTITFPGVKVGSIIEYKYKILSTNPFNFLPWYFQTSIPVRFSQFFLLIPGSADLRPRLYGYTPLKSYDNGWLRYGHRLVMENIPAFRKEEYVKNVDDHYSKVVFEYVSEVANDWESLMEIIMNVKGFGATLEKLNRIKKLYPAERNWQVNKEDLKEIHTYISNHFKWDGSLGLIFSGKPKKVWETTSAGASDINLFLLMFLRKAGFNADPVFLSTVEHGLINPDFPTFRQFNYVVVKTEVDGEEILLDATSKNRPFNILPDFCLNDSGMVVKPGPVEWVPMNLNGERSNQSYSVLLELDDMDELVGEGVGNYSNAAGAGISLALEDLNDEERMERFKSQNPGLIIDELSYEGTEDPYKAVRSVFEFSTEGKVDAIGSRLFFSPVVLKEVDANPFKEATRTLPVEFTKPLNRRYFFSIPIPDGYEIESLPEAVNFVLPNGGGSYSYICQQVGNEIQTMIRFNVERLMFGPAEYPDFRELFNLIIAKQEEKVILREK
jgi:hypothetical protein